MPKPSILDNFEPLGARNGKKRWRNRDHTRLYTWDELHGEVEVFSKLECHLGALDPITGDLIKEPVRGRRIDV